MGMNEIDKSHYMQALRKANDKLEQNNEQLKALTTRLDGLIDMRPCQQNRCIAYANLLNENEALRAAIPEGCTPADARVLREANHALVAEIDKYKIALKKQTKRCDVLRAEAVRYNGMNKRLDSEIESLKADLIRWQHDENQIGTKYVQKQLKAENKALKTLLLEAVDEILGFLDDSYPSESLIYPDQKRRYERDCEFVDRIRKALREGE